MMPKKCEKPTIKPRACGHLMSSGASSGNTQYEFKLTGRIFHRASRCFHRLREDEKSTRKICQPTGSKKA
jgi:hypothetical protein